MRKPETSDDGAQPPAPPARSPYRPLSHRKRAAALLAEPESPVRRPGTVIFQASPITIAAALGEADVASCDATLAWTAKNEDDATG